MLVIAGVVLAIVGLSLDSSMVYTVWVDGRALHPALKPQVLYNKFMTICQRNSMVALLGQLEMGHCTMHSKSTHWTCSCCA